MAQRFV